MLQPSTPSLKNLAKVTLPCAFLWLPLPPLMGLSTSLLAAQAEEATAGNDEKIQKEFLEVSTKISEKKSGLPENKISQQDMLEFYALYKQATQGDCNTPSPSRLAVAAHAKWQAWKNKAGTAKITAMVLYIKHYQKLLAAKT